MKDSSRNISKKAGLPPGTLIHLGKNTDTKIKISVMNYSVDTLTETTNPNEKELHDLIDSPYVSWINIDGLNDVDKIASIGNSFNLHSLLLEDVLNTEHRPKIEEFNNNLFLTLKMLGISKDKKSIISEQVSFVIGNNWVISFQEYEGDIFDSLRDRIRSNKGTIRQMGADFLFYRLVDTVVDNYFFIIEHFNEVILELEEKVFQSADEEVLQEIQSYKKELINLGKSIVPLRDAMSTLQKIDSPLINTSTLPYIRDVYEHIIHVNDSINIQRDLLSSVMDLHFSRVSYKMNEVMKVLTIIATIFIPLTFIAGIYGMNFSNMPELSWKYGYISIWGIMIVIFLLMLVFFKRKKWL